MLQTHKQTQHFNTFLPQASHHNSSPPPASSSVTLISMTSTWTLSENICNLCRNVSSRESISLSQSKQKVVLFQPPSQRVNQPLTAAHSWNTRVYFYLVLANKWTFSELLSNSMKSTLSGKAKKRWKPARQINENEIIAFFTRYVYWTCFPYSYWKILLWIYNCGH